MNRYLTLVAVLLCLAIRPAKAQAQEPATLEQARAMIQALQAENQALRQALNRQAQPSDRPASPQAAAKDQAPPPTSTETGFQPRAWLTAEYQFDTRGFNTINFTGATTLPHGFSLWGFIDLEAANNDEDQRFDTNSFFYEIDLKRNITDQFGLIVEVNDSPGMTNALGRAGVFYAPKCEWLEQHHAKLYFKAFPVETDGRGGQVSMAWNKAFPGLLDGRFSVGGFIDFNIDSGPGQNGLNIVSDTQFRYKLTDRLSLLAELRYNEFLSSQEDTGVGVGLKYRF